MSHSQTPSRISRIYAQSLFQLISNEEKEKVRSALSELSSLFSENSDLKHTFGNPLISSEEKLAVAGDLAKLVADSQQLGSSSELKNFLLLLTEHGRIDAIAEIAEEFSKELLRLKNCLSFDIVSAHEVASEERKQIENTLRAESGGLAEVSWSLDPELLGGLLIRSGDRTLDGTVRGGLRQAKEALLR